MTLLNQGIPNLGKTEFAAKVRYKNGHVSVEKGNIYLSKWGCKGNLKSSLVLGSDGMPKNIDGVGTLNVSIKSIPELGLEGSGSMTNEVSFQLKDLKDLSLKEQALSAT